MIQLNGVSDLRPLTNRDWLTSPLLGVVCTVAGLLICISSLPLDVSESQDLVYPTLAFIIGILMMPLLSTVQAPFSILHPVNVLVMTPIYWVLLDILQAAYDLPGVSHGDVVLAYLCIATFICAAWIGGLFKPWQIPRDTRFALFADFSEHNLFSLMLLAFALAFFRFAIPANFDIGEMLKAFTVGRWAAPWSRGFLGGWNSFLDHMGYFGYILPALVVILARKLGWLDLRTVLGIACAFIIAALESTGGGRRILGVMAGSGLAVWYMSTRRPQLRHLFGTATACGLLLGLLQLVLIYRNVGIIGMIRGEAVDGTVKHLHVDDNFLRLSQIVGIIPEKHDYVTWQYPLWVAVRPIPRVFWPDKPTSPGFDLPSYLGDTGVSYSMSIIGELYMCGGLFAVAVGGLLLGWAANSLAAVLMISRKPGALIVFGIGLLAIVAGVRSGIDLVLMNYGLLAWFAVVWLYRRFRPEQFLESNYAAS